jgi:hypothetical protein
MYYPKSQITPNLYSNGTLVYKTSRNPYYGYYYATSDKKYYTGRTPNNPQSFELILLEEDNAPTNEDNIDEVFDTRFGTTTNLNYSYLTSKTPDTPLPQPPKPYISSPTESERLIGEYRRYFAKKGNELLYIEIDKDTYNQFNSRDPKTLFNLYEVIFFPFSLTSTGININLASIIERRDKWYGFSQFIQSLS